MNLDTRELAERQRELQEALSLDAEPGALDDLDMTRAEALAELAELDTLESEVTDWQYGASLIPEDEFEEHARQLAEDIGAIDEGNRPDRWPFTCIDWSQAADELQSDYSEVTYQGVTYYYR